jgi:hypothetical protein
MINKRPLQACNVSPLVMPHLEQVAGLSGIFQQLIGPVLRCSSSVICGAVVLIWTFGAASAESGSRLVEEIKPCSQASTAACPPRLTQQAAASSASPWKLVRARGDKAEVTTVSIMKTADTLRSDPDFAGLMVRCAAQGKVDVLIVLVTPLPPRSHPRVAIAAGEQTKIFEGTMAAAGAAVVLPDEAGALASGPWQRLRDLAISVEGGGNQIKGAVGLDGLAAAYNNLISSCSQ